MKRQISASPWLLALPAGLLAALAGCASHPPAAARPHAAALNRPASTETANTANASSAAEPTLAAKIDPGPAFPVAYATSHVSPAVVRLDVVTENFEGGQARPERSIGSGVIIDNQGHVLTNFHVAGRAKRIDITLANQEHVRAHLVGSDHWTDLAIVQLDMNEIKDKHLAFAFAPLGESNDVKLGQSVLAIGTPYGYSRTVTMGIISNTDRFFDQTNIDGYETGWFNNWIQTDAAINPGNSGGPLINLRGQVIGINTRGVSEGNNLGFAIPIDVAKKVIHDVLDHGKVDRSYIGIQLQPLQDLERYYDISTNHGALIRSVDPDSPASRAGLQVQDILLAVNGQPVTARFPEQLAAIRKLIADQPIGSTMTLTLQRGNNPQNQVTAKLTTEKLESVITEEHVVAIWGITVRDLTHAYLRSQRMPLIDGVLVTSIREGSVAKEGRLEEGDIITAVGKQKVATWRELQAAAQKAQKAGKPVAVDITRDRSEQILVFKPDSGS